MTAFCAFVQATAVPLRIHIAESFFVLVSHFCVYVVLSWILYLGSASTPVGEYPRRPCISRSYDRDPLVEPRAGSHTLHGITRRIVVAGANRDLRRAEEFQETAINRYGC